MARRGACALLLLCIVLLSAAVDARELLHKHHKEGGKHKHWKGKEHGGHKHWKKGKEHGHHHMHDGPCKPIARVLHETPSLKRFAQAFDEAHVSYLQGLFWDPHAEATFLVVPDTHLGSGDTVFDEAPIRFQQHTMLQKVKMCKAKNGDTYDTLANTTLTVVRDSPAGRGGRKLQQLSTAWTTLLDELLPASSEAIPGGDRPVSNAAFATLPADAELLLDQLRGGPRFSETPGWQGPRDGPRGGPHGGPHGGPGDAPRDAPHGGPHGPHGPHSGPRGPHDSPHDGHSVEDVVAHAFKKAEKKAAKHGAIYLQSNTTSQRIKVLASVRACEGTVLFVSAFLNAPPTPEPVALARGQQRYVPRKRQVHGHGHWEEHRHHHGHRHGLLRRVKHAFAHLSERVLHFFNPHHHDCKRHAKKQHFEEPETHILGLPEQPVDPELLAFYAAHERAAGSEAMEITQEQTDFEGTLAMPAVIADEGIAKWSEEPQTVEGSANLHERAWAAVADPHPAAVSAVVEESLPADHAFPFGAAVEALDAEAESVAIDAEAADAEFATNDAAAAVAESVASWEPEQRVYDSVSGEEWEAPEASWLPAAVADAFGTLEDSAERLAERLHLYGIV